MLARFLTTVSLFVLMHFLPAYLSLALVVIAMWKFHPYIEALVLAAWLDVIRGAGELFAMHIPFIFFYITVVCLIAVSFAKKKLVRRFSY